MNGYLVENKQDISGFVTEGFDWLFCQKQKLATDYSGYENELGLTKQIEKVSSLGRIAWSNKRQGVSTTPAYGQVYHSYFPTVYLRKMGVFHVMILPFQLHSNANEVACGIDNRAIWFGTMLHMGIAKIDFVIED